MASDLHLSPADPDGIDVFERFVNGPCRRAERLLLLGDLFDFWVTPSQARDPQLRRVLDLLAQLAASGVDVCVVEGNRDFAATPELVAAGARALGDVGVLVSGHLRVAFTHGDVLCTRDVRYQALRRVARRRTTRHLLRVLPSRLALGVGEGARAGSRLETARKAYGDMGLDAAAVAALLRRLDADALVCGHVHWGRRHAIEVDGASRDIVVLSAWEDVPTYARLVNGRLDFLEFAGELGLREGPNPSRGNEAAE